MLLKDLFLQYSNLDLGVSSIEIDSRLVKQGSVFFALKGKNLDGARFVDDAFANGAVGVVVSGELLAVSDNRGDKKIVIVVDDVFGELVLALQKFYSDLPQNILAVTGTNGKTSVACFVQQMQEALGFKSAMIGTLGVKTLSPDIDKKLTAFALTTPDIVSLYKNLAILKRCGIDDVVVEASSIGLEQNRLAGLKIGAGAFTNFSQDHLDYHQSMEKYFDCKKLLFAKVVCDGGLAVLNADIIEYEKMKQIAVDRGLQVVSYSAKNNQPYHLKNIKLLGDFQKTNLLCALLLVGSYYQLTRNQTQILIDNLNQLKPAKGRMQLVTTLKNDAKVFIDYAHTPDALQNVLAAAKQIPHNNLLVLFGCGGNRDKSKRPQMGKIASDLADIVVVTDDNPREENAAAIRKDILSGCILAKTAEVKNREIAIVQAIARLQANDILVVAGKGHEKYQIIGTEKIEFDEEKIINNFVANAL